jgi:hypothetical protein
MKRLLIIRNYSQERLLKKSSGTGKPKFQRIEIFPEAMPELSFRLSGALNQDFPEKRNGTRDFFWTCHFTLDD